MILHHSGFPIRKSADQCLFTAPRSLSQLVTSFVGSRCQGILLMLFFAWTSFKMILSFRAFFANNFSVVVFTVNFAFVQKFVVFLPTLRKDHCVIFNSSFQKITLVFSQLSVSFSFFIRFSMNILQSTRLKSYSNQCIAADRYRLVGSSGLEPPTSRLSGARSNHLSYEPISYLSVYLVSLAFFLFRTFVRWWRWWDSNPWPPACRAGALPAELHPHLGFLFK